MKLNILTLVLTFLLASMTASAAETYGATWIIENKGNLHQTPASLQNEGFQYISQHNMYRKDDIPNASLMTYLIENGKVKQCTINLASYANENSAHERWNEYVSNFENTLKGRVNAEWVTTQRGHVKIRIYNFKDYNFMVGVTLSAIPFINKYVVMVKIFSKGFYDIDSACNSVND